MTIRKCGYADERGELREELVHNKQDCPKSRAQQKKQKHMQNGATGDNFKCWLQLHRGSVVATTRWWVAGKAHAGFAEAHTPPPAHRRAHWRQLDSLFADEDDESSSHEAKMPMLL
jgi:hypothetical protein